MTDDLNISLRSDILKRALQLESLVNDCLKSFLEIKLTAPTKTLSYKASSIAFKTKIDLLFDISKIDKAQHDGFDKFMNIRNQFMHNVHANSYCFIADHIDGLENWLLKNYPVNDAEQLKILDGYKDMDKNEGTTEERECRLQFMILKLNIFLSDVIIEMIAKDKKERERYINGMVGYNYYKIVYSNIDPAFDSGFNSEFDNLKKQNKENITLTELNDFRKAVKAKIRKYLDEQIDKEMPLGSSSRNWLENQFADAAKKEKDDKTNKM
jgi:hypothetical protein